MKSFFHTFLKDREVYVFGSDRCVSSVHAPTTD